SPRVICDAATSETGCVDAPGVRQLDSRVRRVFRGLSTILSLDRISQQGRTLRNHGHFRRVVRPAAAVFVLLAASSHTCGQAQPPRSAKAKKQATQAHAATNRFAARAEVVLANAVAAKGEWGLLIVDAATGEMLYEQNADKYFVPASNMKLLTTALALAKLGPEFRFHTTLETHGTVSPDGTLNGDVYLVGRGDPNLSNRKFPYELKEEFDGAPEKVIAELADALVAKGVKQITGDVVGDDSYFPREIYPDGWEIGDIVWNYGAAISAIVVDDNTVNVTLTPGDLAGSPVKAELTPATPDFYVQNDV